VLKIGRERDADQRRQPKRQKTIRKDDNHCNWPRHTQSDVQANHCGLDNPDTAENNGKFSQKLWNSVTGHKDRNVDAVAGSQKKEGQRQHVETGMSSAPKAGPCQPPCNIASHPPSRRPTAASVAGRSCTLWRSLAMKPVIPSAIGMSFSR